MTRFAAALPSIRCSAATSRRQTACAGIAEVVAGGGARQLHSHAQPKIYNIIEGTRILTIDGVGTIVTAGAAIFIPGCSEQGLRN